MGKKNIIGLSLLLLVFLLGLSTTSYASNITVDEIKNIIYNSVTNFETNPDLQLKQAIANFDYTNVENILALNYVYVYSDILEDLPTTNSKIGIATIYGVNSDTKLSTSTNKYVKGYYTIRYNFVTGEMDYGLGSIFNGEQYISQNGDRLQDCRYNELPLYSGTSGNVTVTLQTGFHPDGIEDGDFTIPPKPVPTLVPVSRPGEYTLYINDANLPAYQYTAFPPYNQGLKSMKFSTMYCPFDYKIVHYDVGYYYYNQFYDTWFVKTFLNTPMNWSGTTSDLIRGNAIVGYNTHYDSVESQWVTEVFVNNEYIHANCAYIVEFELLPDESISAGTKSGEIFLFNAFYLTDENTVVVDGNLDIDNTFNNNYYDNYKKDTDDINQKATDTTGITDIIQSEITDVPNVAGMLNQLTSGDMFSFADNLGFVNRNDSYWNFLYQYTYRICQVLLQDTDPYFDFTLHGETPTRIYAHDIGLPLDHPLRPIVSMFFLWGFIWIVYLQFKDIVEAIETANAPKVAHLEDADMIFYV